MGASLDEFLRMARERLPPWIDRFQPGDAFERTQFFSSRVVYYPGSGEDGQPVKLFGSTHAAHCFVFVDCRMRRHELEEKLTYPIRPSDSFKGYHSLARINLAQDDLAPCDWIQPIERVDPFGFVEVLERNSKSDDAHGPRRIAVMFLGADAIASYGTLFCQSSGASAPFAVVVVDHGFGDNRDRFGRGGLLERIARSCRVYPRWLLVAENTIPWDGYARVPDIDGESGGMHRELRFLHQRT